LKLLTIIRAGVVLSAGAVLVAGVGAGSGAATTFNVTTTVDASCTLTDAGPANLNPTYAPLADTGIGSATSLNTTCTGPSPTVTFSDASATGTSVFTMTDGGTHSLTFQISNKTSCDGGPGDDPIVEGAAQSLTPSYAICAAVITGGSNTGAAVGVYSDTVTYAVSP